MASKELGLRTAEYFYADNEKDFYHAVQTIGFPCVVKPLMSSSGKGQSVIKSADDIKSNILTVANKINIIYSKALRDSCFI